jgi:MFS family permease
MGLLSAFNLVTLLSGFTFFSFILLIPLFTQELELSLTATGIVLASSALAIILFSPLWGHLADRLGSKRTFLILGHIIFALSSLLHFFADSLTTLVLLRFLQGAAFATNPLLTALFAEHFGKEAARRFGSFSAANALGWGLGSILSGVFADLFGIRWAFVLVSLFPLISAGIIHWKIGEVSQLTETAPQQNRVPSKLFYLYATIFARHSAAIALWSVFPIYLRGFVGSFSEVGAINGLNMLVQPLFMLAIGRFGERWGKLKLVLWGILGSIATFLVYASAESVWQVLLGQLMIAAAWSAIFIGLNLYIIEEVPQGSRGKAFGYLQSAMTSAAAVGPLLGGALADAFGIREMIVIVSLLMASSLPFLLRLQALDRSREQELAGAPCSK